MKAVTELLVTGGIWYTLPMLILGIFSLILIVVSFVRLYRQRPVSTRLTDTILFIGFLCFAWGVFGQVTGMFQAAGAIVRAGDISPTLIWTAFRISLITVLMGFIVLLYSSIGWYLIRLFHTRQPKKDF